MTEQDLKITDKRMFTPEGELREEFRHLEDGSPPPEAPADGPEAEGGESETPQPRSARSAGDRPGASEAPPPLSGPAPDAGSGEGLGSQPPPGGSRKVMFEDLVGLLAEHAAIALGDAPLPDGKSMFDLRAAQMYIDLLDILREKTAGNLSQQQSSLLEELLYRLRLVYVEKSREKG